MYNRRSKNVIREKGEEKEEVEIKASKKRKILNQTNPFFQRTWWNGQSTRYNA